MGQNYRKILSIEEAQRVLREAGEAPVRRCAFQGVALSEEALLHTYVDCIFLECKLPKGLKRQMKDSLVFPNMGELFRFPTRLYSADTLYEGYTLGRPDSLQQTFDARVFRHYLKKGKIANDIKETLARTLHDHSISTALHDFLSQYCPTDIVGVMGGHGIQRDAEQFRQVALLSKKLTEAGKLMISGGGPGAMEATHLGAWMAGRTQTEFDEALRMLAEAPSFHDERWLEAAMQVRHHFPQSTYVSVGVPTWLYGHEPATPLASHIAKFFDNSLREDGILTLAFGGIVYTPGAAGTLQEIFQEAVQNHYLSFGFASPMVFFNTKYWTEEVPVYPFLLDMVARGKYNNLPLSISDDVDEITQTLLNAFPHTNDQ